MTEQERIHGEYYGDDADTSTAADAPPKPTNQAGRRFKVMSAFLNHTHAALDKHARAVWLILWNDTDASTGTARVSHASVAARAGCSERTVKRAAESLKSRGLLKVVRKGGLNRGPNTVRVLPTAAAE